MNINFQIFYIRYARLTKFRTSSFGVPELFDTERRKTKARVSSQTNRYCNETFHIIHGIIYNQL